MKKFWVGFSSLEPLGSKFILDLYNHFGDIESAFYATFEQLSRIDGLNIKKVETFLNLRDKVDLDKTYEYVVNNGIDVITFEDFNYPQMLKEISNPPAVLYVKGDLSLCNLEKTVAVVSLLCRRSRRSGSKEKSCSQKQKEKSCGPRRDRH